MWSGFISHFNICVCAWAFIASSEDGFEESFLSTFTLVPGITLRFVAGGFTHKAVPKALDRLALWFSNSTKDARPIIEQ